MGGASTATRRTGTRRVVGGSGNGRTPCGRAATGGHPPSNTPRALGDSRRRSPDAHEGRALAGNGERAALVQPTRRPEGRGARGRCYAAGGVAGGVVVGGVVVDALSIVADVLSVALPPIVRVVLSEGEPVPAVSELWVLAHAAVVAIAAAAASV